jgi:hypothetical protein
MSALALDEHEWYCSIQVHRNEWISLHLSHGNHLSANIVRLNEKVDSAIAEAWMQQAAPARGYLHQCF